MNWCVIPALEAPLVFIPPFQQHPQLLALEPVSRPASVPSASVLAHNVSPQAMPASSLPPPPSPYRSVPTCQGLSQTLPVAGEPVLPSCSCRLPYQHPFSRKEREISNGRHPHFMTPFNLDLWERVWLQTPAGFRFWLMVWWWRIHRKYRLNLILYLSVFPKSLFWFFFFFATSHRAISVPCNLRGGLLAGAFKIFIGVHSPWVSQVALVVKNLPANAGDIRDAGLIPGLGRSAGGGNSNPLQYSCLENSMDRGAWQATVHGVAEPDTERLSMPAHLVALFPGRSRKCPLPSQPSCA